MPCLPPLQARIITESCYPYRVVFANHKWEQMCGWEADEVVGQKGLSFMQGPDTDRLRLERLNAAVKYGEVGGIGMSMLRHCVEIALYFSPTGGVSVGVVAPCMFPSTMDA